MPENIYVLSALALIIGYGFGCFSTAYVVGKANHIDIRSYGSGNAGTTNAMRTLGKKAGIITYIGDVLKAVIPILIARFLLLADNPNSDLICFIIGFGVVLGHNYPVWLRFKGGKGIAVTSGVFLAVVPQIAVFALLLFVLIALISKYISLASICAIIFAGTWIVINYDFSVWYIIVIACYVLLALWQHRANIVRLLHGTENKIGQHKPPLVEKTK